MSSYVLATNKSSMLGIYRQELRILERSFHLPNVCLVKVAPVYDANDDNCSYKRGHDPPSALLRKLKALLSTSHKILAIYLLRL